MEEFDLIIAGGGSIGVSLALSLGTVSEFKIAIVEAQDISKSGHGTSLHPGFDARVVALAKHSADLLAGFGLNKLAHIATAIKHIHVSDQGHLGQCHLHSDDYQLPALGYVVALQQLGEIIHQALAKSANLSWFCPDQVEALVQQEDHIQLSLSSGTQIRGKLLVVAEGGNSPTRELLNIATDLEPYGQMAIIANVVTEQAHNNWAYERFTEQGPLALLPLSAAQPFNHEGAGYCSLVWTVDGQRQPALMQMSEHDFLRQLQDAFGYRLGRLIKLGERSCYPLQLIKSRSSISHRAVVIGNAAQSLHPIAGQGLNLGLRDVEALHHCLRQAVNDGTDIGQYPVLRKYQRLREQDQRHTIGLTDTLVRIFSNDYWPLVIGRNLGLLAMSASPLLKAKLARQAMGLGQQIKPHTLERH